MKELTQPQVSDNNAAPAAKVRHWQKAVKIKKVSKPRPISIEPLEWKDFQQECIVGSDIRSEVFDLNFFSIEGDGYPNPIFDALNIIPSNCYQGHGDTWNRQHGFGGKIYASYLPNGDIFNAKPRIPRWNRSEDKSLKYEAPRKEPGAEGNTIFYPSPDQIACDLLKARLQLDYHITPENYWDIIKANPSIPVSTDEGSKKAASLVSDGFPAVAILGVCNWSVSGSNPRVLLPELAVLAKGGREIQIWYDQDDPETNRKAFKNGKAQAHKLAAAIKAAGGKPKIIVWDGKLGKGIDDAKATIRDRGGDVIAWLNETITTSVHREIYAQTQQTYKLDLRRPIERDSEGDYFPGDIKLELGKITCLIGNTGCGKTTQIKNLIDRARAKSDEYFEHLVFVFDPTNNLGKQVAKTFDLPHKDTTDADGIPLPPKEIIALALQKGGLIVCPDSIYLVKKVLDAAKKEYGDEGVEYTVVCDEAAKILEHLSTGNTISDRFAQVNTDFSELLTSADSVIIAEAKIGELDLLTYERLSKKSSLVYRHNKVTAKRKVEMLTGEQRGIRAMLLAEVVYRLKHGEKVMYVADSQRHLEQVHIYLSLRFPDKKMLRVDSTTGYQDDVKEFLDDANEFLADRQLDLLLASPVIKSGFDLTGRGYEFDLVGGSFSCSATSDQIQELFRYRLNADLLIAIPEIIVPSKDESYHSSKQLNAIRQADVEIAVKQCNRFQEEVKPDFDEDLQHTLDRIYVHNTTRNGMEKSIARYSLQQRLIEDGHTVVTLEPVSLTKLRESDPEQFVKVRDIRDALKKIDDEIDVETSNLTSQADPIERITPIAQALQSSDLSISCRKPIKKTDLPSTDFSPEVWAKAAARAARQLEQISNPTPEERAMARKIRLQLRFPGVDFNNFDICYHSIKKYGKTANGADTHARLSYLDLTQTEQREKNTHLLGKKVVASHHLRRDVQKTTLFHYTGVLDLLGGSYSKNSPELIALKERCLAEAPQFKRYWQLDFKPEQEVVTFWTRLVKILGYRTKSTRPNGSEARVYQILTVESVNAKLQLYADAQVKIAAKIESRSQKAAKAQLIVTKRAANIRKTVTTPDYEQEMALAKAQAKLDHAQGLLSRSLAMGQSLPPRIAALVKVRTEIEVRDLLYYAALDRLALKSTTTIHRSRLVVVDSPLEVDKENQPKATDNLPPPDR